MKAKMLEVRDSMTCMPCLAVSFHTDNPDDAHLMWRSGWGHYGNGEVLVMFPSCDKEARIDPMTWPQTSRTRRIAHEYIVRHFNDLAPGDVVDVQFILGETTVKKEKEPRG